MSNIRGVLQKFDSIDPSFLYTSVSALAVPHCQVLVAKCEEAIRVLQRQQLELAYRINTSALLGVQQTFSFLVKRDGAHILKYHF